MVRHVLDELIGLGPLDRLLREPDVWTPVPKGQTAKDFCKMVLTKTGVVITPGNGFGEHGEGYFRMALTQSEDRIREAVSRMKKL